MSAQGILEVEHPLLISSGWKQALLLGLVTDKVELRITIEGGGISPGSGKRHAATRTVTTKFHDCGGSTCLP